MTGFEQWTSGIGIDHSANCAPTTAGAIFCLVCLCLVASHDCDANDGRYRISYDVIVAVVH